MRRSFSQRLGTLLLFSLVPLMVPSASTAASLPSCSKGTIVKTVKGKSTMILKGKRVACTKATTKPAYPVPSTVPQVRFASNTMNDLVIRAGLTITLRNTDTMVHTLVIVSEGVSVAVAPNDISAFLAPTKPGTYQMTTAENPNIKAVLTVVP